MDSRGVWAALREFRSRSCGTGTGGDILAEVVGNTVSSARLQAISTYGAIAAFAWGAVGQSQEAPIRIEGLWGKICTWAPPERAVGILRQEEANERLKEWLQKYG
jgi:hypothetical protein